MSDTPPIVVGSSFDHAPASDIPAFVIQPGGSVLGHKLKDGGLVIKTREGNSGVVVEGTTEELKAFVLRLADELDHGRGHARDRDFIR